MNRYVLGILCALVTSYATAAPPEVPKTLKVKPGQMVRVTVKTDAAIGTLKNFTDEEAFWGELVGPKGQRQFVFQAPALEYDDKGKVIPPKRTEYVIGWWTGSETEGVATTISVDVGKVVPPNPDDGKKDDTNPPKPPVVPPGKRFIVIIEETAEAVPARGVILASPDLAARIRDQGHKFRLADKDNKTSQGTTTEDLKPYIAEATGKKIPRLYFVAPDGTVVWWGDCPTGATAAKQILELLKAAGG